MGYAVDIWSVTSFNKLRSEAEECDRWSRLHPLHHPRQPYISTLFEGEEGVSIAVTDYMKALAGSVAKWIPLPYEVLGTDGYGLSETRECIRSFFEVSPDYICQAALSSLYRHGHIDRTTLVEQSRSLVVDPEKVDPSVR